MSFDSLSQSRFFLIQVIEPRYPQDRLERDLAELSALVLSYGGKVIKTGTQRLDHPHQDTFIGSGKVAWLREQVDVLEIDTVVINAIVKPSQLFRVEKELWEVNSTIRVWDKLDLILGIFEKHAKTREAKLQIELAQLKHTGPRVYGLGGTVLSRQGGGFGQRGGGGETNIEFEKRQIKVKMGRIQKELLKVRKQKSSRMAFRKQLGFGPVALVGYTSAGKTTVFNQLTGKEKEMKSGLFTTLDTVVGKMKFPDLDKPIIISDTIGFITDLPPELIEAFKSTLMESAAAELLLEIIDVSDPDMLHKIEVVETILKDLKITQPVVRVFNKIDALSPEARKVLNETLGPDELMISAKTGTGLDTLKRMVYDALLDKS